MKYLIKLLTFVLCFSMLFGVSHALAGDQKMVWVS
jgi:hypothetical protein